MLEYWSPEKVTVNGVSVPLKEAMVQNKVPYWHSPAAMWLVLGVYALAGCVIAVLLRSWLTRGAQWKKDQPSDEAKIKESGDKPKDGAGAGGSSKQK